MRTCRVDFFFCFFAPLADSVAQNHVPFPGFPNHFLAEVSLRRRLSLSLSAVVSLSSSRISLSPLSSLPVSLSLLAQS